LIFYYQPVDGGGKISNLRVEITLYQAFLDAAIAKIKNQLDLQYYQIPQGFELKEATVCKGKKQTQEIVTTS
jgi:phycoerythrobilin:ferredoxin oxidoreductase